MVPPMIKGMKHPMTTTRYLKTNAIVNHIGKIQNTIINHPKHMAKIWS